MWGLWKRRGDTHHSKLPAHLVGQVAKDEHTRDSAREGNTADGVAVMGIELFCAIYALKDWMNDALSLLAWVKQRKSTNAC